MKQNKFKKIGKNIISQIKKIAQAWSNAKVGTYGASVAYYTVFSIAPLLVIALSVTGVFADKHYAQQKIISEFQTTFGSNGAELIETLIKSDVPKDTNIIVSIVGFILLFIGATGIFSQLQQALDTIFESLPEKKTKGVWRKILQKLLSLGMVLSVGFVLLVSLAISAFITHASGYVSELIPYSDRLARSIEVGFSFILVSFFLALVYKVLPSRRLKWKPALIGGCIAGIFFTLSKYILGLYFGSSHSFTSYGAASSLVLLIIWAYYMSQVFFLGAIMIRLYIVPKKD